MKTKRFVYNPHHHVKIWFSNNPNVFMSDENQMRLIDMREKNPDDTINLVYDSSLLNTYALKGLIDFCTEHNVHPVDANTFGSLITSEKEKKLYDYYKDEITHLKEGGNLAVASDIIRWVAPVYTKGTYTDFDVPVDTSSLPPKLLVDAPLLLNIGSLKIRSKELVLSNNDYIAVIDPQAAKKEIEKIQDGFIKVLGSYTNDFIEKIDEELGNDNIFDGFVINFMRNRTEAIYISRSKSAIPKHVDKTSRGLRAYINEIMSDPNKFLDFNKKTPAETQDSVIQRLRKELSNQLGLIKWLFFRNEYNQIKTMLALSDDQLVLHLMKKERTMYLKSIVVCTTGPIAIANFLFNNYVFGSRQFLHDIQPYSFNTYGLRRAFQSKNSLRLHENVLGMLKFLGAADGELNDSSWLEEGANLQKTRGEMLAQRKKDLGDKLPNLFAELKSDIEQHRKKIENETKGFWGLFRRARKQAKIKALDQVLACFGPPPYSEFNVLEFRVVLQSIHLNREVVYAGLFFSKTKDLVEQVEQYCHETVILGLTRNNKINLFHGAKKNTDSHFKEGKALGPFDKEPNTPGLAFFNACQEDIDLHGADEGRSISIQVTY